MKQKFKIVVGPENMFVSRLGICSDICQIGNEYIKSDSEKAINLYFEQVHEPAKKILRVVREYRETIWRLIDEDAKDFVSKNKNKELYFDGPEWVVSFTPWKQAKYGGWFIVTNKLRNKIKKHYRQRS